jgi:hypothetical protein
LKRLVFFFTVLLWMTPLSAQDSGSPLLPDIDPQDIEIRGDFVARFAGITRQPILGFSPKPRVFRLDPNRMPYLESQAEVVASLPISDIDRPQAPTYSSPSFPTRHRVLTTAGFGNYWSPEASVHGELQLTERSKLLFRSSILSSQGQDEAQPTSFRLLNGDVSFVRSTSSRSRLTIGAYGRHDFSYLNMEPGLSAVVNAQKQVGGHLTWRTQRHTFSQTEFNLKSGYTALPFDNGETRLDASLSHSLTLPRIGQWLSMGLHTQNGLTGWAVNEGRFAYHARIGSTVQTTIGAKSFYGWDEVNGATFFATPDIRVQFKHPSGVMLRGELGGAMSTSGLATDAEFNRFYTNFSQSQNELSWLARGLAQYATVTGVRLEVGTDFIHHSRIGYFERAGANLTRSYGKGFILKLHSSASIDIVPESFTAFGTVYLQNASLKNEIRMPFHERYGASVGLSAKPTANILGSAWVESRGPRTIDQVGTTTSAFTLVNAKLDLRFSRTFGLYIKGTNLLNRSYTPWIGYPMLPIQAYGGFTLLF